VSLQHRLWEAHNKKNSIKLAKKRNQNPENVLIVKLSWPAEHSELEATGSHGKKKKVTCYLFT
jgi:hypothetical protein